MFSRLKRETKLKKLKWAGYRMLEIFKAGSLERVLIVRDPYSRAESFFRDKLRENITDRVGWQPSQRPFLEFAGISPGMQQQEANALLRQLSFPSFIEALKTVHSHDPHLHPQHWVLKGRAVDQIIHLEMREEMESLGKAIGIDLSIKENTTQKEKWPIHWTNKERQIINQIYEQDFKLFGYPFK